MRGRVLHPLDEDERFFEEGCFILELASSPDDPALSVARARVPAGATTRWHRLRGVTERYVILEGQGRVEVGDLAPAHVAPGDVVVIPPMARQRITAADGGPLVFLALCTPRFTPEAYDDLGG